MSPPVLSANKHPTPQRIRVNDARGVIYSAQNGLCAVITPGASPRTSYGVGCFLPLISYGAALKQRFERRLLQREGELGADAFGADNVDVLVVGFDDLSCDGETEAGSVLVAAAGCVCLVETYPDLLQGILLLILRI